MGVLLAPSSPGSLERKQLGPGHLPQPHIVSLAVADTSISRLQSALVLSFCSHMQGQTTIVQGLGPSSSAGSCSRMAESKITALDSIAQCRNTVLEQQERHLAV